MASVLDDLDCREAGWIQNHPKLREIALKIEQIKVKERLGKNKRLPKLDLEGRITRSQTMDDKFDQAFIGVSGDFYLQQRAGRGLRDQSRYEALALGFERQAIENNLIQKCRGVKAELQATVHPVDDTSDGLAASDPVSKVSPPAPRTGESAAD